MSSPFENKTAEEIVSFIEGYLHAQCTGDPDVDDKNPVVDALRTILVYARPFFSVDKKEDNEQVENYGTAFMRRGEVDWKQFAQHLLWCNIVSHKNEDSGYDYVEETGSIGPYRFSSCYVHPFKALTWKELALALGLFEEHLIPDGHDCHHCKEEKTCKAYFKYDTDHERCNGWPENKIETEDNTDGK